MNPPNEVKYCPKHKERDVSGLRWCPACTLEMYPWFWVSEEEIKAGRNLSCRYADGYEEAELYMARTHGHT